MRKAPAKPVSKSVSKAGAAARRQGSGATKTARHSTRRSLEAELAAWFKQFDEKMDRLQARQAAFQKELEEYNRVLEERARAKG